MHPKLVEIKEQLILNQEPQMKQTEERIQTPPERIACALERIVELMEINFPGSLKEKTVKGSRRSGISYNEKCVTRYLIIVLSKHRRL